MTRSLRAGAPSTIVNNVVYTHPEPRLFTRISGERSMKKMHLPLLIASLLLASQSFAATAQQDKMKTCNADATAKTLKGDERKSFMSSCLKAAPATQQEKMKTCNATATGDALKGDARKAFMSECLKKK
jgi:hypothetical protein